MDKWLKNNVRMTFGVHDTIYLYYASKHNKFLVQAKSYKYVLYRGNQKSFLHYF